MSEANEDIPDPVAASPLPYVVLCGFCLGIIFLAQMQQGLFLANLLVVMVGVLGLVSRLRLGPILLLAVVGGVQTFHQTQLDRMYGGIPSAGFNLQIHEIMLCAAVLGYVAGHYRLQGLWYNLWPEDVRQHSGPAQRPFPWLRQRRPILQEKREPEQVKPLELVWFVVALPLWSLFGFLVWAILGKNWNVVGLPVGLVHILFVVLFLAIIFLVARMSLGYWRHRGRDEEAARLYLQEVLWKDTRGEQRRLNRWLAWWKKEE
jgi:uncharacterized protein with PQ loop repeat